MQIANVMISANPTDKQGKWVKEELKLKLDCWKILVLEKMG